MKKDNLSNFSIEILFPTDNEREKNKHVIERDKIIEGQKLKKKMLKKIYKRNFKLCMKNIKESYELNKNDTLYHVPLIDLEFNNYNVLDCIEYILYKLKKLSFEVFIYDGNYIYINWANIENNIKK
tara:strand:- start:894 stop:1271 length:378 start_codon:yes stop_codon:yes gene_type:complete